jgi:glycosyltransferase involved in cell wall biosynthesis
MPQPNRLARIALVTPMLPTASDGTRGRYILETAAALARRAQVRVFFQLSRYPQAGLKGWMSLLAGDVDEPYATDQLDVEAFSYPSIRFATRLLNGLTSSRYLTPRMAAFAPDIVLGYWIYPDGFAALRAARALGVPCLLGALGSDILLRHGFASWLSGRTIRRADGLLTVSEAMRRVAMSKFGAHPEKVHAVVNGYNTCTFSHGPLHESRRVLGLPQDRRLIVYVGRLVPAKGLRELLDAFAALSRTLPECDLAIVGDGPMRSELRDRIAAMGCGSRVRLTGGLEPAEVAAWIRASDLLTLPSWSEGHPNVVVEALACGRPVVATDVGGTRELVDSSNGVLLAPRRSDLLEQGLRNVLGRNWDHAAIASRMKRTWDDVAEETLEVCRKLMSTSGKSGVSAAAGASLGEPSGAASR